jgi:hypothetical protein
MLDLSGYDLVITSEGGLHEGVPPTSFDIYLLLSFSDALPLGRIFRLSSEDVTIGPDDLRIILTMCATGIILLHNEGPLRRQFSICGPTVHKYYRRKRHHSSPN